MNFIEKPLCKNNAIYIFSYFLFVFMNVSGTIFLVFYYDKESKPLLFILFDSFFMFLWGMISRCICIKCDKEIVYEEIILDSNDTYLNI